MNRGKNPRTGVATDNDQSPRLYDLGWLVWQVGSRIVKRARWARRWPRSASSSAWLAPCCWWWAGAWQPWPPAPAAAPATTSSGYRAVFSLVRAP
jgi:hypothetical protein